MKIGRTMLRGRQSWVLDNDRLALAMLEGGGHIASVTLHGKRSVNPLWVPIWKTIEPWKYRARDKGRYGIKLLAAICGHNLCLGWFGSPSPEEQLAGLETHGEAPVVRWRKLRQRISREGVSLTCGCKLPVAQMSFERTLTSRRASNVVHITEKIRNLAQRDQPFTICQHVTVGPPFLEKGVTLFDLSAVQAHTFRGQFGAIQRLKPDTAFTWPHGPGAKGGTVDMRLISKEEPHSSDFSTQLMDVRREDAWFSAVNPTVGLLLAYIWKRSDFPWLGNWEENFCRTEKPWAGRSLTRGMEFANTPFPIGLRGAVDIGPFQDTPTFRWLPARGTILMHYSLLLQEVPPGCRGVTDILAKGTGFEIDLMT